MSAEHTAIVQKQEAQLLALFLRKTGDPQEAWDLLQGLYESVLTHLDAFAEAEDQAAWLFRAAHNRVIDWYRKKDRQHSLSLDAAGREDTSLLDLLVSPGPALENRFFRNLLLEELEAAVNALPGKLRSVIVAQALEGRSFRELSREWKIPLGTLLSRKREALRLLGEVMDDFREIWEELYDD